MSNKTEFQQLMEELKSKIYSIQKAVAGLRKTGIDEKVLFKMIQDSAKKHYHPTYGYKPTAITIKVVRAVIEGIEGLEEFVFPKDED